MCVWRGLLGAVMESHWGAAGKTVEEWGYVTHHSCVCVSLCEWEENSVWEAVSSPGWSEPDEKAREQRKESKRRGK